LEKRDDIINFYATKEFKETWKVFLQICKREGKPYSVKIRELITDYSNLHALGNPQQTLPYLFKNGKPYRAPTQCGCGRLATHEFNAENVHLKVCKTCLQSLKMRYDQYSFKPLKMGGDA